MLSSKDTGTAGETISAEYLASKGFIILTTNFRYRRFGEIDIIAKNNDAIVFVEVKSRRKLSFGTPAESINSRKISRIKKIADYYLLNHGEFDMQIRFDVIEVYFARDAFPEGHRINHIINAF